MIIMGVDLGQVRTGISVCDPREVLASPVKVITAHTPEKRLEEIHKAAGELRAGKIVVGLPRNMDGTEGASALSARETAARLQEITGLPVVLQDERGTTMTAHGYLNNTNVRGKKRRQTVDAVAAVIILQDYLDSSRRNG
ncbi:MAG: Holliday junction resolvase RuvX [Clostridia bacterium]|nr:Holliday junction resolvase RuvX [Clostridia bacterium]MDD7483207.1 Holliday junction resolvase RuvX [Clostridia bacterium]